MAAENGVVEQIRQFINANPALIDQEEAPPALTAEDAGHLQELAEQFAEQCRQTNERAYQCQELLKGGKRSEAGRIAKAAPDLGSVFKQATFGELRIWLDICETYGLALPYLLDYEVIENVVDDVYGLSHAKEELVRLHRRLAMSRAPLGQRVRVLRRLHQIDVDNSDWTADLDVLETALVEQLSKDALRADRLGDLATLTQVRDELASDVWLKLPSEKLVRALDERIKPHRQRRANRSYQELSDQIRNAHAAMDEAHCRLLLTQWRQVELDTGFGPSDVLAEGVEPVEQWLGTLHQAWSDEQAFQIDCKALDSALDAHADRAELDRLACGVLRYERGMPDALAARLNSRMEDITRRTKRSFALKLTGILGGVGLVAAIVIVIFLFVQRDADQRRWVREISKVVKSGQVEQADSLLSQLEQENERIYRSAPITALRQQLDEIKASETTRREGFEAAMARAENAGVVDPDLDALNRAEDLAKLPAEKSRVAEFFEQIERHKDEASRAQQQAIESAMTGLEDAAGQLGVMEFDDLEAVRALAARCKSDAEAVLRMAGLLPHQQKRVEGIIAAVEATLAEVETTAESRSDVEDRLAELQQWALRPSSYVQGLSEFRAAHPNHALSAQFAEALALGDHWQAVEAWNTLVAKQWAGSVRVSEGRQAAERRDELAAYLERYPAGPCAPAARQCANYLNIAAAAFSEDSLIDIDALRLLLQSDLLANLQVLTTDISARYYFLASHPPRAVRMGETITHYELELYQGPNQAARTVRIRADDYEDATVSPAPQTVFAASALERIGSPGMKWEKLFLSLASDAAASTDIEPILRAQVVMSLLASAEQATPFVTDSIAAIRGELEGLYLGDATGLEEDTQALRLKRQKADERLRQVSGRLAELVDTVDQQMTGMAQAAGTSYWPVGMAVAGQVRLPSTDQSGMLFVLVGGNGEAPQFAEIGRLEAGEVDLVVRVLDDKPQGTLVFVRQEP